MSKYPNAIITDGSIQYDTPQTIGQAMPMGLLPKEYNYADDPATAMLIQEQIIPVVMQTRQDRLTLHQEWWAINNMEMLIHDAGQRYRGRSNSYIPVFNRNQATLVASLSRGLFPSDEYIDVSTEKQENLEAAKDVKTYMQWEFERVGNVRRAMKPFLKQLVKYGNSPLKYVYEKRTKYKGKLQKDPTGLMYGAFRPTTEIEGLRVSARSLYNVYVYPQSADTPQECTMMFEDLFVSLPYIEEMLRAKKWKRPEIALNAPRPSELDYNSEQILETMKLQQPQEMSGKGQGNIRAITEVWTYLKLPSSAYMPGEDTECPIPVLIILAGNEPIYVDRNPFWHQNPPYLWARSNVEPGLFYGYGFGRTVRGLQYLTNDFANQTNDVGSFSLNPIALVNPGALAGPMPPLRPGAVISVTDPSAIRFERPPVEITQYGIQFLTLYSGMAQDYGGAPPILQGQGAGKTGKTATGAQILQRNAMGPLQDQVEDLELDVMVPLLRGTWCNAQQFREDETFVQVAGKSLRVTPELLSLDCDFRWLASSQAVNQQMRAQQAIQLIQAIMPIVPLVMQQGYIVDPVPLIRRIYTDGFGFRGFDEFIKQNPQAMMQQMGQMGAMQPAGNPQMPQAEQGDRMRSALEQIPGVGAGGAEMAPGEGEAFGEVRQNADNMAADAGTNYGVGE